MNDNTKSTIHHEIFLNKDEKDYDDVERMKAQDQIYWQWLHGLLASSGAAAVCTFLLFSFSLIARESVLLELFINRFCFRSGRVSLDGNANNSPGSRA